MVTSKLKLKKGKCWYSFCSAGDFCCHLLMTEWRPRPLYCDSGAFCETVMAGVVASRVRRKRQKGTGGERDDQEEVKRRWVKVSLNFKICGAKDYYYNIVKCSNSIPFQICDRSACRQLSRTLLS